MSFVEFSKQLIINQLLGVPGLRRVVDSPSSRPSLAPAAGRSEDIWSNPLHPELALRKFRRIGGFIGDPACCRDRTVVEIGPGMSFGMGIVAIALGARRAILIDRERYVVADPRTAASHSALLSLIPAWIPDADPRYQACVKIDGDEVVPDSDLLRYVLAPAEELPLPSGSVDLMLTHSTLEHIRDLDRAVAEFYRVAAPGSAAVHHVDLADHLHPSDPLRMLTYSGVTWELIASHRRGWTNRLRLDDHRRCFESKGFTVEKLEVLRTLDDADLALLRQRVNAEFTTYSDDVLRSLGYISLVRRK